MIVITTGREPARQINSLIRDLTNIIPNVARVRRGKSSLGGLIQDLTARGVDKMIAIYRWKGGPGRIEFYRVSENALERVPPTMILSAVRLRREYGIRGKFTVGGITLSQRDGEAQKFAESLASFLELPVVEEPGQLRTSLHLQRSDHGLMIVVTSPAAEREVGPMIKISRLLWS